MTLLSCRGITSKYSPKGEFLKRRAVSLHRSGYRQCEIADMLHISAHLVYDWTKRPDRSLHRSLERAERAAAIREAPSVLPVLAFVPHIELTKNSKYQMRAP